MKKLCDWFNSAVFSVDNIYLPLGGSTGFGEYFAKTNTRLVIKTPT